jgi:hypothetical protein
MPEHSEFYKKMMEVYDRQIAKAEEPMQFSEIKFSEINESNSDDVKTPRKTTKEKKPRPVSKTQLLNQLKEKYPFHQSDYNKYRDRTPFQYHKLVSTKNLVIAEFVLKWEHVKKKRIHKNMAWKIFTQLQTNDEITNEFLTSLLDEFENQ